MKNTILSAVVGASLLFSAFVSEGAITSTNAAPNTAYTLPTILGGGALVTKVTITADSTHNAYVQVFDLASTNLSLITPAYIGVTSYATNYYSVWTNYFGVVNYSITNVALIDVTNTVAASTNLQQPVWAFSVPTNQTVVFDVRNQFYRGITITNIGANASNTISFQYSQ